MANISSAALSRLGTASTLPYATVERMTRPLIALDRWPSRKRTHLRSSDLASIINAIASWQPTGDAAEADAILRTLEYKTTWPPDAEQAPALGERTWGALLERLIENQEADFPNGVEVTYNPLSIGLIWCAPNSTPKRRDIYLPSVNTPKIPHPYGAAKLIIRKTFIDPGLIQIAGEILRDQSPVP